MTGRRQFWFWLGGIAAFAGALYVFRAILFPFVAGMAVAYLLDPAVDKLEKWGLGRTAGTALALVAFFVFAAAALLLLVPVLQSQIFDFAGRVPELFAALRARLSGFVEMLEARLAPEDIEQLRTAAANFAGDALALIGGLVGSLWSGGLALFNLLSLIFITPIVAFYLLRDWDRMVGAVDGWLPLRHAEAIRALAQEVDELLSGFVRGVAMVCLILGACYGIALSLIGLEFGLFIGLTAGLLSFVPFIGALFGFVISVGVALAQFTEWVPIAIVAGVFVLGQVVEGNFLTPRLVGKRVGLHPVWVIFALLAGGVLFGFVGLLLAVPLAVVIGVLVRFGLGRYLASPFHRGSLPPGAGGDRSEGS
ncbi:MAG: AI-2E family transporter [Alphaproteobacteria bacterium]